MTKVSTPMYNKLMDNHEIIRPKKVEVITQKGEAIDVPQTSVSPLRKVLKGLLKALETEPGAISHIGKNYKD